MRRCIFKIKFLLVNILSSPLSSEEQFFLIYPNPAHIIILLEVHIHRNSPPIQTYLFTTHPTLAELHYFDVDPRRL